MFAYCLNNCIIYSDNTGQAAGRSFLAHDKGGGYVFYTLSTAGEKEEKLLNMHMSSLSTDPTQPIYRKSMCVKCTDRYVYTERDADIDDLKELLLNELALAAMTAAISYSPLSLTLGTNWIGSFATAAQAGIILTTGHNLAPGIYDMYKVVTIEAYPYTPWETITTSTYYAYDKNADRFIYLCSDFLYE